MLDRFKTAEEAIFYTGGGRRRPVGDNLSVFSGVSQWRRLVLGGDVRVVLFKSSTRRKTRAMSRKELLDARKALRGVREGVSGPRSKKQRGEWKLVLTQNMYHDGIKWAAGS